MNNNHLPSLFLVLNFDVRILRQPPLAQAVERVPTFNILKVGGTLSLLTVGQHEHFITNITHKHLVLFV